MHIHFFQHVHYESPGTLLSLLNERKHTFSFTLFYDDYRLPELYDFDLLIILGGPMSIYDDNKYPFLKEEKNFIRKAIARNKMILGICLGAQLLADALSADIYRNSYQETGWFYIQPDRRNESDFLDLFKKDKLIAFHWHSDTFDLPEGSQRLFSSDATLNQGFMFGNRILALQFHWEINSSSVTGLINNSDINKMSGKFIQSPNKMLSSYNNFMFAKQFMIKTLKYFETIHGYTKHYK